MLDQLLLEARTKIVTDSLVQVQSFSPTTAKERKLKALNEQQMKAYLGQQQ